MRREDALRMYDAIVAYLRALSGISLTMLLDGEETHRAELVALLMRIGKRKPEGNGER